MTLTNKIYCLRLHDVDPEVEHDELLNLIYDHVQGEIVVPTEWCASAVKVSPKRPRNNWVLEIHPALWKQLISKGRVYLVWESYKVEKYLRLTKCYKCQRFGHIKKYCPIPDESASCGTCTSSEHETHDCLHKNITGARTAYWPSSAI
jgi:hypothetical protein